jgi:hypothetical protein
VHYPTDTIAAILATAGVFLVVHAAAVPIGRRRPVTVG